RSDQNVAGGGADAEIVVDGKIALGLAQDAAVGSGQRGEELPGAVGAEIVNDDDLVVVSGQRGVERGQAEAGEVQAVVDRHDDAEFGHGQWLREGRGRLKRARAVLSSRAAVWQKLLSYGHGPCTVAGYRAWPCLFLPSPNPASANV